MGGRPAEGRDFFLSALGTSSFLDHSIKILQQVVWGNTQVFLELIPSVQVTGKRIRIIIDNCAFRAERKAMHYTIGDVRLSASLVDKRDNEGQKTTKRAKAMQATKEWAKSTVSEEGLIKPRYDGTGEVFLEPNLDYMHIFLMEQGDKVVLEGSCWYASDGNIEVTVHVIRNVLTAAFSKALFHTRLVGEGWFVLKMPVPFSEIHRIRLDDSKVRISEGRIVLLRRGDIKHKIEKATKSVVAMKATGEGIVHAYSGTGEIWLMPTLNIDDLLEKRFQNTQEKSLASSLFG